MNECLQKGFSTLEYLARLVWVDGALYKVSIQICISVNGSKTLCLEEAVLKYRLTFDMEAQGNSVYLIKKGGEFCFCICILLKKHGISVASSNGKAVLTAPTSFVEWETF